MVQIGWRSVKNGFFSFRRARWSFHVDSHVSGRLCENPNSVRLVIEAAIPQLYRLFREIVQQGVQGDLQRIRDNDFQGILCERRGIPRFRDGQKDGI